MDLTPGSPEKGARAKVKTTSTTSKEAATKARARKSTTSIVETPVVESATPDIGSMIATAAYFIAAERNFEPGHELDDWLEAERRVLQHLA